MPISAPALCVCARTLYKERDAAHDHIASSRIRMDRSVCACVRQDEAVGLGWMDVRPADDVVLLYLLVPQSRGAPFFDHATHCSCLID